LAESDRTNASLSRQIIRFKSPSRQVGATWTHNRPQADTTLAPGTSRAKRCAPGRVLSWRKLVRTPTLRRVYGRCALAAGQISPFRAEKHPLRAQR
jgi:hypothetical protein